MDIIKNAKRKALNLFTGLAILANNSLIGQEQPPYDVRGYLRIVDEQGNEMRRLIANSTNTYTLEAWAENPKRLEKSIVNFNLRIRQPQSIQTRGSVPFDANTQQHYLEDYFRTNIMGINRVSNGLAAARETKYVEGSSRAGIYEGKGVVGKWKFQITIPEEMPFTNAVYETLMFDAFAALNSDLVKIPTRTRSLKVQIVPEGYNELNLMYDFNDGQTPGNDVVDKFGRPENYMTPDSVPEPIVVGNGKANVLERSVGDASGPWTAVWTNKPTVGNMSASGAFSDKEMKGFDKVFYRVREYTGQ